MSLTINFNSISNSVQPECDRLMPDPYYLGAGRAKAQKINAAIDRLYLAIVHLQPGASLPKRNTFCKIDTRNLSTLDLSTVDAMLDAEIGTWESEIESYDLNDMEFPGRSAGYTKQISLRVALNIADKNILNGFGEGTWGPLWGKARALETVENRLRTVIAG